MKLLIQLFSETDVKEKRTLGAVRSVCRRTRPGPAGSKVGSLLRWPFRLKPGYDGTKGEKGGGEPDRYSGRSGENRIACLIGSPEKNLDKTGARGIHKWIRRVLRPNERLSRAKHRQIEVRPSRP